MTRDRMLFNLSDEDVAPLYVFLGSDESSYINGAEIAIDGGVTATHAFGG